METIPVSLLSILHQVFDMRYADGDVLDIAVVTATLFKRPPAKRADLILPISIPPERFEAPIVAFSTSYFCRP